MNYREVINPRYISDSQDSIECEVNFDGIGLIPFLACQNDTASHGREIYQRLIRGDFGTIESYTPEPVVLSIEQMSDSARSKRNSLLVELDTIVCNPFRFAAFSNEYKTLLQNYRQALLDLPDQPGFPTGITWPEFPAMGQVGVKEEKGPVVGLD